MIISLHFLTKKCTFHFSFKKLIVHFGTEISHMVIIISILHQTRIGTRSYSPRTVLVCILCQAAPISSKTFMIIWVNLLNQKWTLHIFGEKWSIHCWFENWSHMIIGPLFEICFSLLLFVSCRAGCVRAQKCYFDQISVFNCPLVYIYIYIYTKKYIYIYK